jgi:hypothetical protein
MDIRRVKMPSCHPEGWPVDLPAGSDIPVVLPLEVLKKHGLRNAMTKSSGVLPMDMPIAYL